MDEIALRLIRICVEEMDNVSDALLAKVYKNTVPALLEYVDELREVLKESINREYDLLDRR